MRTTIDIHDELLARAKQVAADRNKRLSELVNDALIEALGRANSPRSVREPYRVRPLPGDGPQPGVDFSDNGSIQDAMDEQFRDPTTGRHDLTKLK